jgi:hypothetical protein
MMNAFDIITRDETRPAKIRYQNISLFAGSFLVARVRDVSLRLFAGSAMAELACDVYFSVPPPGLAAKWLCRNVANFCMSALKDS